jgi:hypothetical protein
MCQALTKELRKGGFLLSFPQPEQIFHSTRDEQIRKPIPYAPGGRTRLGEERHLGVTAQAAITLSIAFLSFNGSTPRTR